MAKNNTTKLLTILSSQLSYKQPFVFVFFNIGLKQNFQNKETKVKSMIHIIYSLVYLYCDNVTSFLHCFHCLRFVFYEFLWPNISVNTISYARMRIVSCYIMLHTFSWKKKKAVFYDFNNIFSLYIQYTFYENYKHNPFC